jgi:hypothetical protein
VLQVIGIVRIAMLTGREALIKNGNSPDARIHQLESEVAMLREELRIHGARMRRVPAHRRPQYTGLERMAILQLRAMRGWNKAGTSRHFLVSDDTIRDWLRRVDDDTLVQTSTPVNRFPDVVRYAVQQIKLFCPTLGKLKIAEKLAQSEEKVERRPQESGERMSEFPSNLLSPFSTLLLYCREAAMEAAAKTRNGYRNFGCCREQLRACSAMTIAARPDR